LLWVLAGVVSLITVAPELDKAISPKPSDPVGARLVVGRAPDGQFYTQATAGGQPLRMMIDPGAERVLLSARDAEQLGLELKPGFTPVVLDSLAVQGIELKRVEAVIAPNLPVSLLGRSYLSRLGSVGVESDRMVLR
jgi:aspartyl protease family protein